MGTIVPIDISSGDTVQKNESVLEHLLFDALEASNRNGVLIIIDERVVK